MSERPPSPVPPSGPVPPRGREGSPAPRTIAEHATAVLARVAPLPEVPLPLAVAAVDGLGLVLAHDHVARSAVPPFDNAAMDGYAVRLADLPDDGSAVAMPVVGDLRPGVPPRAWSSGSPVGAAQGPRAVRIMTGAPLPAWADAVVPVECTSTGRFVAGEAAGERDVTVSRQSRTHVRRAGEDVQRGDVLARAGQRVTPALVAAAAAGGLTELVVHRRPRVAVISTGSELVASGAGAADGVGAIPDSNSLMLAALARAAGADVLRVGAVPDDADALRRALDTAAGAADLVVTSGGVSAGASDVVREVLADLDVGSGAGAGRAALSDVDVAAVAMRPGRPQALARWHGVPWVAVPGNPVSAFVSFVLFARPAIERLGGAPAVGPQPHLPADRTGERRAATGWASPPGREQVLPVRTLPSGEILPAVGPGARTTGGHLLSGLLAADGLAIVPASAEKVEAGDRVTVLDVGA
jgi:molybdopterin molybdotransferase